jgi:hypothetical protein
MHKEYTFNSSGNFQKEILNVESFVPERSKGRKTEHTEKYSIVSFLRNFYNNNYFNFPFTLTHRDKPDFSIISPLHKIGIEFTESIPEQLARAEYLLEKYFGKYSKLEPEFFDWDAPERTDSEILNILQKSQIRLIGQGYAGKSVEENWLLGIQGCITNKTNKLNNSDFERFECNYLLIYDNQTKPMLDKNYVNETFFPFLKTYWNGNSRITFDKVFIDSGKYFFVIEKEISPNINVIAKIVD